MTSQVKLPEVQKTSCWSLYAELYGYLVLDLFAKILVRCMVSFALVQIMNIEVQRCRKQHKPQHQRHIAVVVGDW
jgi:hypothetical protein